VLLHEGLGSAGLWGDFPREAPGRHRRRRVRLFARGYSASTPAALPRLIDTCTYRGFDVLPKILDAIGFRGPGWLVAHSDGASDSGDLCRARAGSRTAGWR